MSWGFTGPCLRAAGHKLGFKKKLSPMIVMKDLEFKFQLAPVVIVLSDFC